VGEVGDLAVGELCSGGRELVLGHSRQIHGEHPVERPVDEVDALARGMGHVSVFESRGFRTHEIGARWVKGVSRRSPQR